MEKIGTFKNDEKINSDLQDYLEKQNLFDDSYYPRNVFPPNKEKINKKGENTIFKEGQVILDLIHNIWKEASNFPPIFKNQTKEKYFNLYQLMREEFDETNISEFDLGKIKNILSACSIKENNYYIEKPFKHVYRLYLKGLKKMRDEKFFKDIEINKEILIAGELSLLFFRLVKLAHIENKKKLENSLHRPECAGFSI